MSAPLRFPLTLAVCAIAGIVGLLLTQGPFEWPLRVLVALPLLAGAVAFCRWRYFTK